MFYHLQFYARTRDHHAALQFIVILLWNRTFIKCHICYPHATWLNIPIWRLCRLAIICIIHAILSCDKLRCRFKIKIKIRQWVKRGNCENFATRLHMFIFVWSSEKSVLLCCSALMNCMELCSHQNTQNWHRQSTRYSDYKGSLDHIIHSLP